MTHDLKSIVSLLLEKEVNFEVFYSTDATKKGEDALRVTLLVELDPTVRVDFGDKRHGQLIRRIHVSSDHRLTLSEQDFVDSINTAAEEGKLPWVTQATTSKSPALASVFTDTATPDIKRVTGIVEAFPHIEDYAPISNAKLITFNLLIPMYALNKVTNKVMTLDSEKVQIQVIVPNGDFARVVASQVVVGTQVGFEGVYYHPNVLFVDVDDILEK